jgi:hypothetical protein
VVAIKAVIDYSYEKFKSQSTTVYINLWECEEFVLFCLNVKDVWKELKIDMFLQFSLLLQLQITVANWTFPHSLKFYCFS